METGYNYLVNHCILTNYFEFQNHIQRTGAGGFTATTQRKSLRLFVR
jgi:hypothetical protein